MRAIRNFPIEINCEEKTFITYALVVQHAKTPTALLSPATQTHELIYKSDVYFSLISLYYSLKHSKRRLDCWQGECPLKPVSKFHLPIIEDEMIFY